MTTPPLLLGLVEGFFALAFFVIAFIGWIMNLINQNQEGQQRNRRPGQAPGNNRAPGNKQDKVQQDIDDFLNQNRRQDQPERRPPGRDEFVDSNEIEVVERRKPQASGARRPPANRQRSRKEIWEEQTGKGSAQERKPPQRAQVQRKKQAPKPAAVPAKPPVSSAAGQGIQNRPSPASEAVGKPLAHQVDASVTAHLGAFRADDPRSIGQAAMRETTADRETPARRLLQLLRTPQGIRQGILLGEVLSKPRVLRRG